MGDAILRGDQPLNLDAPHNRLLSLVLAYQSERYSDTCFIKTEEAEISYRQMQDLVDRYSVWMHQRGIGKEDRICLLMVSCIDYVALTLAANALGAVWVPVNTDYKGDWLHGTLVNSAPKITVVSPEFESRLDELGALDTKVVSTQALPAAKSSDGSPPKPDLYYGDTVSVMWTSGTTGNAKGVMQSHNTWIRSALSAVYMGGMKHGDTTLNVLPLHNSAAWVSNIYPALLTGATCVLVKSFSAGGFWQQVREYEVSHTLTLGAMHMFLWDAPERTDDEDNPLRSTNMVPMPDSVRGPFKKRFGIESIHQGFGQSEIMYLLRRCDDGQVDWPENSLGVPADDIEICLLDDEGAEVGEGAVGELCVKEKAPHVLFNGYFRSDVANANAFRDGWYHTGDLLRREGAHYFFVDRKSDLIRYKGRSVSSLALESVALKHSAVTQAAAFGITSAELEAEHEIMLAVVLEGAADLDEQALAKFVNDNAPYYFVPRYIEIMDQLPLTPTQKIQKHKLRDRGVTPATWDAIAQGFKAER
jgi:crotonobetaine/carnitine-CoA ligase